jgi:hypothetical protein
MLHISRQTPRGFLQPINQWSYLRPARVRHQQSCNGECGFFKLLELAPQTLAIFIEILQRFIAVHKVTIRGFTKLHVLDALMRQLLIFIFKYLSGILLSVDNVLQIGLMPSAGLPGPQDLKKLKNTCQTTARYPQ